ncbi:MAG: CDP-alcohol phosphatidyltransferase family protein [Candidatus Zixiibacteriota bacterium]
MSSAGTTSLWTVPNLLSLSRVILLPVWWWVMDSPDPSRRWWGAALIAYGILSDVLDGYLARRWGQVSLWGKVIDPVGDKLAGLVIGLFCVMHRGFPLAAFLLGTGRDLVLVVGGWVRYRRTGVMPISANLGRYAAFLWGVLLLLYAFDTSAIAHVIVWPTVALYLIAGIDYLRRR